MQERKLSLVDQLRSKQKKLNDTVASAFAEKNREQDPRFWRPSYDENGIGYASIRFLPQKNVEELPYYYHASHGFLMPNNQWYINNCLLPTGGKCPACERLMWDDHDTALQDIYKKRKARKMWMVNIVVIQDKAKPENNGKVFLWDMTTMFHKAIMNAMNGETPEGIKFNPFDVFEGANLKIQVEAVGKGKNKNVKYACFWSDNIGPLSQKDETLEKYLNMVYDLGVIAKEKKYELKSYDELDKVLVSGGMSSKIVSSSETKTEKEEDVVSDLDGDLDSVDVEEPKKETKKAKQVEEKEKEVDVSTDEDDDFNFDVDDDSLDIESLDLDEKPKTSTKEKSKPSTSDEDLDDLLG